VTAGIGSIYRRTNGGTGTTIYRKESGTGNTGWVASANGGTGASEQTIANADTAWGSSNTVLRQSAALTANHSSVMPAASGFPAGTLIMFVDKISSPTSNFSRSFSPAGSDTIDGATDPVTPFTGAGSIVFEDVGTGWLQVGNTATIVSLQDTTDKTKQVVFDLSGLPTGTTRTVTAAPGGNSVTVRSSAGSAGQFATGIGTDGVITYATGGTGDAVLANSNVFTGSVQTFVHIAGSGSTPSHTDNTGAGTSPTITVSGNDIEGVVSITVGTGSPAASAVVTRINFAVSYAATPHVVLSPNNAAAAALSGTAAMFGTAESNSKFDIMVGSTALTASSGPYLYVYHVFR
jgi:hypothetical protein